MQDVQLKDPIVLLHVLCSALQLSRFNSHSFTSTQFKGPELANPTGHNPQENPLKVFIQDRKVEQPPLFVLHSLMSVQVINDPLFKEVTCKPEEGHEKGKHVPG
jgi:hypothetical protein